MNSRRSTVYLPRGDVLWTLFEFGFALVIPVVCVPLWIAVSRMGPGRVGMEFKAFEWAAAIEVVVYLCWRVSQRGRSPRMSALYAGWLAAGSAIAATIALWQLRILVDALDTGWSFALFMIGVAAIPACTAVAFARGACRAWRFARQDPSFSAPVHASAAAVAIVLAVFFWPASSYAAFAWSIKRVDRGDARSLDEAAQLLERIPWADTGALVTEWESRMGHGRDVTQIETLYERVAGHDLQREL
jgi:hypothetical protein